MKKNLVSVAVAATVVSAGAIAQDQMFVSPDNTGQVLVFPYYNAENGNATTFHVVNTTGKAKAAKVRFREYKASLEVLDFNLYLSPYDHFSFAVVAHPEGLTDGAAVITADTTCTYPALGSDNAAPYAGDTLADGRVYQPFVNFEFYKAHDSSDTRTLAGYVEVIEMGVADTSTFGKAWAADVTHSKGAAPKGCAKLGAYYASTTYWGNTTNGLNRGMAAPEGGLYGISYHLNVDDAAAFGIEPLVIDDWTDSIEHNFAGSNAPTLTNGNSKSVVIDPTDGEANELNFTSQSGAAAVSSLIMSNAIMNDVIADMDVGAQTDWVQTFPTKHFHVNQLDNTTKTSIDPFTDYYWPGNQLTGTSKVKEKLACEYVTTEYWDREEYYVPPEKTPAFSPAPPTNYEYQQLCYEVETLMWDSEVGALNGTLGAVEATFGLENGWAKIDLGRSALPTTLSPPVTWAAADRLLTDDTGDTLEGLPVIGFAAVKYVNSAVIDGAMMSYGHVADHKTETVLSD